MTSSRLYIATGFQWAPGKVISNKTFAKSPHKSFFRPIVPPEFRGNPDYLARRQSELELEEARRRSFPSKPSRREAIFLSKTSEDAERWVQRGARSGYTVYELAPIAEHNSCQTNYVWYNYIVRLFKNLQSESRHVFGNDSANEIEKSIEAYWLNEPTDAYDWPSQTEVLYVGKLSVIKKFA